LTELFVCIRVIRGYYALCTQARMMIEFELCYYQQQIDEIIDEN